MAVLLSSVSSCSFIDGARKQAGVTSIAVAGSDSTWGDLPHGQKSGGAEVYSTPLPGVLRKARQIPVCLGFERQSRRVGKPEIFSPPKMTLFPWPHPRPLP